jgi:hypothetical protein
MTSGSGPFVPACSAMLGKWVPEALAPSNGRTCPSCSWTTLPIVLDVRISHGR